MLMIIDNYWTLGDAGVDEDESALAPLLRAVRGIVDGGDAWWAGGEPSERDRRGVGRGPGRTRRGGTRGGGRYRRRYRTRYRTRTRSRS